MNVQNAYNQWSAAYDADRNVTRDLDHTAMQQTLQPAQVQFAKIGAPHDSILLEDLPLVDMSRYKMVIFLNCYHLTEEQRQWIRERILCGGRTVLWCYAAGLFDGARTCLENMQELTGFQFAYRLSLINI